jgi:hypothetical protein
MKPVIVESTQWSPSNSELRPIDDSDAECLEEIRSVLQKHNRLERFGVSLLHPPFDIGDDEILLETTDVDRREQFVRPVKKSFLADNEITVLATAVGFDENGYHQICGCNPHPSGHSHH